MRANDATKYATLQEGFAISFDKKALKEQAISISACYENMRHSLNHPLILRQLKPLWRAECPVLFSLLACVENYGSVTQTVRPPLSVDLLNHMAEILGEKPVMDERLNAWIYWVNGDECMKLAPEYRALLATYYLHIVHPYGEHQALINRAVFTYLLRCAGLGDFAEGLASHYFSEEKKLTAVFKATQKSRAEKNFQTQWIQHYFVIFNAFLIKLKIMLQHIYERALFDQACYRAAFNERQSAIIDQLLSNVKLRDKKSLFQSSFYRALYLRQSRRTQERDFKSLCDQGIILMCDTQHFKLTIDEFIILLRQG